MQIIRQVWGLTKRRLPLIYETDSLTVRPVSQPFTLS